MPSRKEAFLGALQPSTRDAYRNGLNKFEAYLRTLPEYADLSDPLFNFLINVKKDRNLDVLEMKYEERRIVKGFFGWLEEKGYAPKSRLVFVASVQSFGLYYQVPISTKFTDPPASTAVNEKCEWTLEMVGKFIESMDSSFYQSLSTSLLQCTLRLSDVIGENLPYRVIQNEFESGIVPVCILIKNSEKTQVRHRTFLGSLAVKKLKAYFEEAGTPKPDEPIYPISDRTVDEYFVRVAKKMFPAWTGQNPYGPHSLRGAASTFLSDALCPESAIEYLGGHSLDKDVKLRYRRRSTERWRLFYNQFEWALDYTIKPDERPKISIAELKQVIDSFVSQDADALSMMGES
jgi:hypothetical protein